ncbi:glutathione S-transferase family protein [Legionella sp. D16C41]|uniref:glutathione S-transferase family protein n=1 Tax=Legionella sp. D16C41 TaxID=3402688 RepID=UPI003AF62098
MSKRILYGSIVSPYVRKVLAVLQFKHLAFELKELIPFLKEHKETLLTLSPLGKIPLYQEKDLILADSSVICAFLEKKYPEHTIYPINPEDYAHCLWYEEYADTVLMPTILIIFFNQILAEKFKYEPNKTAVKEALEKLPQIFTYLEQQISNKDYLVANILSMADISIVVAFLNLELTGFSLNTHWQTLSRYITNISRQDLIQNSFIEARARLGMSLKSNK